MLVVLHWGRTESRGSWQMTWPWSFSQHLWPLPMQRCLQAGPQTRLPLDFPEQHWTDGPHTPGFSTKLKKGCEGMWSNTALEATGPGCSPVTESAGERLRHAWFCSPPSPAPNPISIQRKWVLLQCLFLFASHCTWKCWRISLITSHAG